MSSIGTFGTNVLENQVFSVRWNTAQTEKRKYKNGGEGEVHFVVVDIKGISNPLRVGPFYGNDWDKLRLLKLSGIVNIGAVRGLPSKEGGYSPLIYSGVRY